MAIIKCKMCGGDIVLNEEKTFGTCEYCGSTMTLPKVSDEQRAARFNRGNHFRRQGEFDKALAVYETIVQEDDTDAEAHWCCALCRFGIEYVEDPNTFEYLPTCHRASFDSFLEDVDYLAALEHSNGITRRQYQKDAAKIAEVQKGILATSQNEDPFDVFICYKETDDDTKERTRDSLDAQEIYYQLTQEGYRVFFSRITLEDKVGTEYEPYIFAALNSAKVMVALGSKPEYFNAVWVKNEWSRFLAMMRKDRSKLLLPCYKGMDPYDLPEQLGVLQSYDMSKIGFMQDLIRGIKKVLRKDEPKPEAQPARPQVVVRETGGNGPNIAALLKRGYMALEDQAWEKAEGYFDQVLNMDAENHDAYLGLTMAEAETADRKAFHTAYTFRRIEESGTLRRARQFAGAEQLAWWTKLDSDRKIVDEKKAEKKRLEEERRKAAEKAERERIEAERKAAEKAERERIEAERKAEEERKRKEEAQAKEDADKVIAAIRKKLSEKGPSLEAQLTATKQRAVELAQLCAGYDDIQTQVSQKRTLLEQYEQKKNQLQKRRASLGLFAGKEKKQIDSELSALDRQAAQASSEHSNLHKRLQGFETKAQAEQAKAKAEASASELEQKLFEQKSTQGSSISFESAVNVLSKNKRVCELVYQKDADLLRSIPVGAFLIASVDNSITSISFGHYPQKDSGAPKPIEWVILRKDSDRLLLISKYALDCKRYNTTSTDTWETCSLRKWLNNEFLNTAFNAVERKLIPTVTVSADKNPNYNTTTGQATQDKVFLLSIPEVNKFFKSDEARKCAPTDYAVAQKAFTSDSDKVNGRATCFWWLRSPGGSSGSAAYVSNDGFVNSSGGGVNYDNLAVRPALWINLEP